MKTMDSLLAERDEYEEKYLRLAVPVGRLRAAWDALCRCNDEFLPDSRRHVPSVAINSIPRFWRYSEDRRKQRMLDDRAAEVSPIWLLSRQ